MIPDDTAVTVPTQLLQSLIWNLELNFAGVEDVSAAIDAALGQCNELQKYLVDADPSAYEDDDFSFEMFDNIIFADFVKRTWC